LTRALQSGTLFIEFYYFAICVCVRACVCVCVYVYVHIYIYICMYIMDECTALGRCVCVCGECIARPTHFSRNARSFFAIIAILTSFGRSRVKGRHSIYAKVSLPRRVRFRRGNVTKIELASSPSSFPQRSISSSAPRRIPDPLVVHVSPFPTFARVQTD